MRRIEVIEEVINYWVPVSINRGSMLEVHDAELAALRRRVDALERAAAPAGFPCVEELVGKLQRLEESINELRRRTQRP